jgi:hypothetical protein
VTPVVGTGSQTPPSPSQWPKESTDRKKDKGKRETVKSIERIKSENRGNCFPEIAQYQMDEKLVIVNEMPIWTARVKKRSVPSVDE